MKSPRYKLKLYTVVEVWRGTAASVRNFRNLKNAQKYMRRLRRAANLIEDDIQVFAGRIRITR